MKDRPKLPHHLGNYESSGDRGDILWLKNAYSKALIAHKEYAEEERVCIEYYKSIDQPSEDIAEDRMVAIGLSKLVTAKMIHATRDPLIKLAERYDKYNYTRSTLNPLIDKTYMAETDRQISGVSLAEIMSGGLELARQQPVEVYGHMLLSTSEPSITEETKGLGHAFLPITAFSTEKIRGIIKRTDFPEEMNNTFLEFSKIYKEACSRTKEICFDPASPDFIKVVQLYQELHQKGTSVHFNLFFPQLLGIDDEDEGRLAYSRIHSLANYEQLAPFHEELLTVIENVFEGKKGEDVYEALGIGTLRTNSINENIINQLHAKKQRLSKMIVEPIALPADKYGQLRLSDIQVSHQKNTAQTRTLIQATITMLDGQVQPIFIYLNKNSTYQWNFLRPPQEVPELFNLIAEAVDSVLGSILNKTAQNTGIAIPLEEFNKGNHSSPKRNRDQLNSNGEGIDIITLSESPNSPPWEIIFPENAFNPNKDIQADAEEAVSRYKAGHGNIEPVKDLLKYGKKVYRLKKGDTRVLCRLEDNTLTVIKAEDRSVVYKGLTKYF